MTAALLLSLALGAFPGFGDMLVPTAPLAARASACRECHHEVTAQWETSRHHHSVDNRHFLDGLAAEPHRRCVICHAPAADQVAEVQRRFPELVRTRALASLPDDAAAREGITCATCHLRDGVVLTANPRALGYGHALRYEPALASPEFCAACHEFRAHRRLPDGTTVMLDEPMQSTFSEWKAWGGRTTCQQCHMPDGRHDFHGGHDASRVRGAVTLTVEAGQAVLRTHGIGHRLPTGDVFRHLVLWADDTPLRTFAKVFALRPDAEGALHQVLVADESLAPDAEVRVLLPAGTHTVRLTYHSALDRHELRGGLRRDELVTVVAEAPANPR